MLTVDVEDNCKHVSGQPIIYNTPVAERLPAIFENPHNPYLMEQIDIIAIAFLGLALLSVILAIWAVVAFAKPVDMAFDDKPGHYEDAEYADRSFIEYFN